MEMEVYYPCCGKYICRGCVHSYRVSGNDEKCPFCNTDQSTKTDEECAEEITKRVEANDATSIFLVAGYYLHGVSSFQQDRTKAIDLYARAGQLGHSMAHNQLGGIYNEGGELKKARFHLEAAAMAGNELARWNLGCFEAKFGNMERAIKHLTIAATAGHYTAMHRLRTFFEEGAVSRESIDSTLSAYNNSCAEMRSESRDDYIRAMNGTM
jgi:TPR repeat protein